MAIATDRMLTVSYPPVEFEHNIPKLECIGERCVALTAGDALAHVDLFRASAQALMGLKDPSVQHVAQTIVDCYVAQRLATIEQKILSARGWTLSQFYTQVPKAGVPADLILMVDRQISTYDYGLEILLAGIDTEAHIYSIRNPGQVDCFDALGYHAIGSGEMHAVSTFIFNNCYPDMTCKRGLYLAYEAKRSAEVAPGVGKALDIALISKKGARVLLDEEVDQLRAIYEARTRPAVEETDQMIDKLPFGDLG